MTLDLENAAKGNAMTPTREQIAAVLWKAAMLTPYGLASVSEFLENATPNNLADALLREYEISTKPGLPESDGGSRAPSASSGKRQIQSGAKSEIRVKEEKNG